MKKIMIFILGLGLLFTVIYVALIAKFFGVLAMMQKGIINECSKRMAGIRTTRYGEPAKNQKNGKT